MPLPQWHLLSEVFSEYTTSSPFSIIPSHALIFPSCFVFLCYFYILFFSSFHLFSLTYQIPSFLVPSYPIVNSCSHYMDFKNEHFTILGLSHLPIHQCIFYMYFEVSCKYQYTSLKNISHHILTIQLHYWAFFFFLIWDSLSKLPWLAPNLWFSYLSLPSCCSKLINTYWDKESYHHPRKFPHGLLQSVPALTP